MAIRSAAACLQGEESPDNTERPYFLTGRCQRWQQTVPQKITARSVRRVRVKTRGKSSRNRQATANWGKPYGLKDCVNQGLRTARPNLEGESIEVFSDEYPR